jgi:hypothetical protein
MYKKRQKKWKIALAFVLLFFTVGPHLFLSSSRNTFGRKEEVSGKKPGESEKLFSEEKRVPATSLPSSPTILLQNEDLNKQRNVAIYFTGQARTLNRTWCSIMENIFQPLIDANLYEKIVIFVVAERDSFSHTYAEVFSTIQARTKNKITVGEIVSIDRPLVAENAKDRIEDDRTDPILTSTNELHDIPHSCYTKLAKSGRWFHGGGQGLNSKNGIYTAELLSQLYYRKLANEIRIKYEKKNQFEFDWMVLARPDTVYIDKLPHPESLSPNAQNYELNTVYSVHWGLGSDENSFSRAKRANGINDRFALGGASGMNILMGMYDGLCNEKEDLPARMNLEQLTYWYLKELHSLSLVFLPKPHRFLFYRLRMNSIWPLEHPGHRPPLIPGEKRLNRLQSYHEAIGFIQKCRKDESQSSDLRLTEEKENCFWNVSELFFRYTNTFLLPPTSWLHRFIC